MLLVLIAITITTAGCGSDKDARSAAAVLADASAALRSSRSYRVTGMLDPGLTVDVVVVPDGSMGTITSHGVSWEQIAFAGTIWFKGPDLWHATLGPEDSDRLGDQWVKVETESAAFGLAKMLTVLDKSIPGLVFAAKPGLKNRGLKDVLGQRVIELENDTDVYDVRADGTPYPIRWLEKETPGPDGKPCGITLSEFDSPVSIVPPTSTVTL